MLGSFSKDQGEATIKILNTGNKVVWSTTLKTNKGYNQFRWDLILNKVESPLPYFIHYNEFIKSGSYQVELTTENKIVKRKLTITDAIIAK